MRSLLTLLVRLFPADFRRQFEADLAKQVQTDYDRARSQGRARAIGHFIGATADLSLSALAEHWQPSWVPQGAQQSVGERMRTSMNNWWNDLRYAVRSLRRAPGFAAVSIATLGLAIGANAGIFSVIDTVLLDPLPYPEPGRLVEIAATAPGSDLPDEFGVSQEFYLQYTEQSELIEDAALYADFTNTLRVADRAERVWMAVATPSIFNVLRVQPVLGRVPTDDDGDDVFVISHTLWQTWFGGDPGVVGQVHYVAGRDRQIIGVMGPDFWFPNDEVLLWLPVWRVTSEDIVPGRFGNNLVARLLPGVTQGELKSELAILASRLPDRFGGSATYARIIEQHRPVVRPLQEQFLGAVSAPLWILLGAVGLVLLIACANVANLFLVRFEHRHRDLAVRRALGAGRRQLIRSQLSETIVIAAAAGVLAVLLAWATVPLLLRAAPSTIPRLDQVGITLTTLGFTGVATAFAAVLCGMLPAVRSSAPSFVRLRDAGRGSTDRRHWGRDLLVVGQTALALVLLIGSGLLVRSFWELRQVDPGYEIEDIFTFQIAPEGSHLNNAEAYAAFHMDFMDRIRAMPGVESVGVVENVPLNEGVRRVRIRTRDMAPDDDGGTLLGLTWAGGDYYQTMGISVLRGRPFQRSDHISDRGNAVISEDAAEALWPGENPIGKQFQVIGADTWETVVGVVEDVMQYGFREGPDPLIYLPLVGQDPENSRVVSSPAYVVKTARANEIGPDILAMVREVAPLAPMYRVFTMEGLAADSMVRLSFTMLTLAVAAGLALTLGAIGLFGVLSYVVAQRTQEIGVRMALGADAHAVRSMVLVQGARVVLAGVVIGLIGAMAGTRILGTLLFGVGSGDAVTFLAMALSMIMVGLIASYLPAWRASRVDPIESLRID